MCSEVVEAFEEQFEVDALLSPIEVWSFYPTRESWQVGDRGATCLADTGLALRGAIDTDRATEPLGPNRLASVWALEAGACFRGDPTLSRISVADCEGLHDYEVTAIRDLEGAPDEDEYIDRLWSECEPFEAELRATRPPNTVGLWDGLYTDPAWRDAYGYSRIVCLVEKL